MSLRHLPPLDLLAPFEASARLGSFTRAAEELAVTQSAVSQRVRKLEMLLDVRLFERRHRAIALTPAGRELLNGVSVALRHLTAATHGVQQREGRPAIQLAVDTSMAQLWLVPRLQRILDGDSAYWLDLLVSDVEEELLGADLAILHGDGNWPGHSARRLFSDEIYPVCAPEYLERFAIRTPEDLLRADLIDLDYSHWNWINWGIWLTEAGLDPSAARILMRTNSYMAQLDAARAGMGLALGWSDLLNDDLRRGVLVRPLPDVVGTKFGYYVVVQNGADAVVADLAQRLAAPAP